MKKYNSRPTISIGIPAHNEANNIATLLRSVLKQKSTLFTIEKIFLVLDGCTDTTEKIAAKIASKHPQIKILNDGKRHGKMLRLNQIYKLNTSDYIATFDADLLLERSIELESMYKAMIAKPSIKVVAANQIPVPGNNFWSKCSVASFTIFYNASKKYHNGSNIHCIQGSATLLKKSISKTIVYPNTITCDQAYLYVIANNYKKSAFAFDFNTHIRFLTVSSFHDWRVLGKRTIFSDKESLVNIFGNEIIQEYVLPRSLIYTEIVASVIKQPIVTLGALILNTYIRNFPYQKKNHSTSSIWDILTTSKIEIHI